MSLFWAWVAWPGSQPILILSMAKLQDWNWIAWSRCSLWTHFNYLFPKENRYSVKWSKVITNNKVKAKEFSINILPWPPWELKAWKTNLLQETLLQYYYSLITNILNILQGEGHRKFSIFIAACRKREIIQLLCHILDYKPRLHSYQISFFL